MDSMNEKSIPVNPVKSRADYLAEALFAIESARLNFEQTEHDARFECQYWQGHARNVLLLLTYLPEPSSPPDPCAEELARQIGVMSEQNSKLYREKSALLDLLTRAYLNRHMLDNDLNDAVREALEKAGRL